MDSYCNKLKKIIDKMKFFLSELGKYNIYTGQKWEDY